MKLKIGFLIFLSMFLWNCTANIHKRRILVIEVNNNVKTSVSWMASEKDKKKLLKLQFSNNLVEAYKCRFKYWEHCYIKSKKYIIKDTVEFSKVTTFINDTLSEQSKHLCSLVDNNNLYRTYAFIYCEGDFKKNKIIKIDRLAWSWNLKLPRDRPLYKLLYGSKFDPPKVK